MSVRLPFARLNLTASTGIEPAYRVSNEVTHTFTSLKFLYYDASAVFFFKDKSRNKNVESVFPIQKWFRRSNSLLTVRLITL